MMTRLISNLSPLLFLLYLPTAHAQMNETQQLNRAVKANQPWNSYETTREALEPLLSVPIRSEKIR
jgi:hypothetical protein